MRWQVLLILHASIQDEISAKGIYQGPGSPCNTPKDQKVSTFPYLGDLSLSWRSFLILVILLTKYTKKWTRQCLLFYMALWPKSNKNLMQMILHLKVSINTTQDKVFSSADSQEKIQETVCKVLQNPKVEVMLPAKLLGMMLSYQDVFLLSRFSHTPISEISASVAGLNCQQELQAASVNWSLKTVVREVDCSLQVPGRVSLKGTKENHNDNRYQPYWIG